MSEPAKTNRRAAFWTLVRVLLGVVGIGVVVWLVRDVGVEVLGAVLIPALPWLPLAAALELARVGLDAVSTRSSLGRRGADVPMMPLMGAHLVAFAVMGVAPAGRATAEAVKAGLLAPWVGGAQAAAVATANQANTLLSSGSFSLLSAGAAYVTTGPSMLTWALVIHFVVMNATGLALRAAARYERLGNWLAARFPKIEQEIAAFHETSRETPLYPGPPVLAMMAGRAFQAAHFAVLAASVGITPSVLGALAFHGVYLVIAAIGVAVPGQLGASEGGFAMSADVLGTTEARALSIALLAHAIQFLIVALGFVVLALWRGRRAQPSETPRGAGDGASE